MREFFRGWRRKMGGPILLAALTMMIAWVRSIGAAESIFIGPYAMVSDDGRLHLWKVDYWNPWIPDWKRDAAHDPIWDGYWIKSNGHWHILLDETAVGMRYWLIVPPLTLLSAYLLLSKPRSKPNQSVNYA